MITEQKKIDINTASKKELTQVSGIGPALAERIIAERPYGKVADLTNVPGIAETLLESIKPALTVAEEGMYDVGGEAILSGTIEEGDEFVEPDPFEVESEVEGETVDAGVLPPEEIPPQTARRAVPVGKPVSRNHEVRPPRPKPVDKALLNVPQPGPGNQKNAGLMDNNENLMYAVIIGVVVLLLAVFLSLGILGVVNRGLSYVPVRDYNELRVQVEGLQSDTDALRQDVDTLQERLDSLETLSGRLTELEDETESMAEDMETVLDRMDELESLVETYDADIQRLDKRTGTFQQFLEDMRTLLIQLVPVDTIR